MKNIFNFKNFSVFLTLIFCAGLTSVAHAAPPAKAFGELPVAYDADISPDGKRLAMILNNNGTYVVFSTLTDDITAEKNVIALGKGVKPSYIKWVNDDRYIVSISKTEKSGSTPFDVGYLYTNDASDDKKGRLLVKGGDIFRQFNNVVVDWLDDDPDHILMAYSTVEYDPYPSIYKVNVETGRDTRIQRGRPGVEFWITDDNAVPRIGRGQTDNGTDIMIVFNPETEKWDSFVEYPGLTPETPIYRFLKDGTEVIIGAYRGRDTLGLYVYDLKQRRITRSLFHNDNYDASGVIVSSDGETVLGAKYVADEEETELLGDYAILIDKVRAKYPEYSVRFVDQTDDYQTIIVRMSNSTDPGGLFMFSRGDEQLQMIGPQYNGLKAEEMGVVIPVKYTSRDGQKIPAYVTMPPTIQTQEDFQNLPFVVLPHGGPYGRDYKRFDYFAQFFATRGYGVMQMNFRGSDGYGKSFEEAGRNNWIVMQEDVEDATKYLFSKGYADPERTCIAGWSYGGYAALMGGAKDTENRYNCVVAMAALTDIADAKRDFKRYRGGKHVADDFFGAALQDKEVRKANTPVERADDIKVPVFLAHGDRDINVHFDQFKRMKKALQKAGADGTYVAFKNEDHFLSRQENREEFFIELEKFLQKANGTSEFMAK